MTTVPKQAAAVEFITLHRLYEAGDFPGALRLLDESDLLATLEARATDPELADDALAVANLYRDLGRFSAAESYYLQALAGLTQAPGKDHPRCASGLVELGRL